MKIADVLENIAVELPSNLKVTWLKNVTFRATLIAENCSEICRNFSQCSGFCRGLNDSNVDALSLNVSCLSLCFQ